MQLTFRQIEALLAELHDVAPIARVALTGRIKHFQRMGWPEGTNTGKGRPAEYGFGQTLALALAFELSQLGISPERIVEILEENWDTVVAATSVASSVKGTMLWCDPSGLHALSTPSLISAAADRASETFWYGGPGMIADLFAIPEGPSFRRLAMINLSLLLDRIRTKLGIDEADWEADRAKWTDAYYRSERPD